jgi:predicted ArsR family transcriptional regulator
VDRLSLLKALGDNTRYAIYLEVARSSAPRSTAEIAETLGLHPNTVRTHLERMREVRLLEVEVDGRGTVGRPQHRYAVAPDAPSLGLEPPPFPLLARLLEEVAAAAGVGPQESAEVGRAEGRAAAARTGPDVAGPAPCVQALTVEMNRLGFDPVVADDGDTTTMAFTHCPYGELAEAHPEIVCHLHRGMVEGFVAGDDDTGVESFGTLVDRRPCQVVLSVR